nr:uncharacterized protein LOC113705802 [Coffea arabica]
MVDIFAALHYIEERQGLNVEIQNDLAVAQINTFSDVVEKAQRVENARLQGDKSIPPKFGREVEGGRQPGVGRKAQPRGGPVGRGQRGDFQRGSGSASHGPYGYCEKPNHTEYNYWKKEGKCLRCGNADHQLATCPVLKQDGKGSQQPPRTSSGPVNVDGTKPKVSARVYSLEPQQIPDPSEVIEGTIPIFHRLAKVLVDPGATYSFVNSSFMCGIDIKPASLPYDLEVSTPTGGYRLITNMVYKDYEVWVGERKLLGDLISLCIKGYDVILGMDWLVRYNAQLDCKSKVVEFRIPGEATLRLEIRGRLASSALISGIRARKLLSRWA